MTPSLRPSGCGEISQMRLDDGIGNIMKQPRRPQRGVKVGDETRAEREAAIQHDRADAQRLGECGDHEPNLRSRSCRLA